MFHPFREVGLYSKFGSRDTQITHLLSILHDGASVPQYGVSIMGGVSTGKSSIILQICMAINEHRAQQNTKDNMQRCYSFVDCSVHSTRTLLEDIVEQIWGSSHRGKTIKISDFVNFLEDSDFEETIYMVFDNADKLIKRQYFEPLLVDHLLRLRQSTGKMICPIFISRIPFRLYKGECKSESIDVFFPSYTQQEATEIIRKHHMPSGWSVPLFRFVSNLIVSACWSRCQDLRELIRVTWALYPQMVRPVTNNEVPHDDFKKLYALGRGHIQKAFVNIYRRDRDICYTQQADNNNTSINKDVSLSVTSQLDIPTCTKYMIIACYLASVIPASHDEYLFSANGKKSDVTKRGEGLTVSRVFTQQRMLNIFSFLVKKYKRTTFMGPANTRFELASLVAQGYLTQYGSGGEGIKYQFHGDNLFVQKLSKAVGFDLQSYLTTTG